MMKKSLSILAAALILANGLSVFASEETPQPGNSTETNVVQYLVDGMSSDSQKTGISLGKEDGAPILTDVRVVEEGGQNLIVKTWRAPPDYDSNLLIEPEFEKGGLRYKNAYLLMVSENQEKQKKLASETMAVNHEKQDDALAQLQPFIEYSQDGFSGQLSLQADLLSSQPVGQSSYNYTMTETKEYTGFERNDTYNIPKSIEKNGIALQLANVSWNEAGEGRYNAMATYSGNAVGSKVTGYVSTATYMGEVSKDILESITYAVIYEGSAIPLPPPDYLPAILATSGCIIILAGLVILWNKRKNTKVFAFYDGKYNLVHKQKLTEYNPIIDLTMPQISAHSKDFLIAIDSFASKQLDSQPVRIIGVDSKMREHIIKGSRSGCKLRIGSTNQGSASVTLPKGEK